MRFKKQCLKKVADQLDMTVTYMVKSRQDQAGSSCHFDLSLSSGEEKVFPVNLKEGPISFSEVFR